MKSEAGEIPISDAFFDFIVNAHILEHSPNPIRLIREWKRVTKPGGTIFFIMPHGLRTFDAGRELVTYQHLVEDYRQSTDIYDMNHAADFLNISAKQYHHKWLSELTTDEQEDWAWLADNGHIHYHVWTQATFCNLLLNEDLDILDVLEVVPGRSDSFFVSAKVT